MKIYVYAIAKNEEKHVKRWMNSVREADGVFVLDTGSEDNTAELLKSEGATVEKQMILPWRFDTARNISLSLVPEDADICVCCDLDEVFHHSWREKLEKAWSAHVTRARYRYTWDFLPDGREGTVFYADKIHARKGYKWVNPVHEVLVCENEEKTITVPGIQLDHRADENKSRAQYLELLELAVRENPEDDRNMHYLGREYMFRGEYGKAIKTLKKHLLLKSALWRDERCASMRYIARCCENTGDITEAYKYHLLSIAEAPYLRESWIDAACFEYRREHWAGVVYFTEYALNIKKRTDTYITEPQAWGDMPYDILSIAWYKLGDVQRAREYVKKAIELSDEQRLKDNLALFMKE